MLQALDEPDRFLYNFALGECIKNEEVYLSMKEFAPKQKSEQERSVLVNEKLKMKNL